MSVHFGPATYHAGVHRGPYEGPPVSGRITDTFGTHSPWRRSMGYGWHAGVDISAVMYTPILAPLSGTVAYEGWHNSFGWWLILDHDDAYGTAYCHMVERSHLREGNTVQRGEAVGAIGSTGASSGPHLHWMATNKRNANGFWNFGRTQPSGPQSNDGLFNPLDMVASAPAEFQPDLAPKGISLVVAQTDIPKGDIGELPFVLSVTTLKDGIFYTYVVGAPDFVNQKFPDITRGDTLLVRT
jgi:hypothetical protein